MEGRFVRLEIAADITERKQLEERLAYSVLEREELYRQLEEEIQEAKQIHEQILPTTQPVIEEMSFAIHYQPAEKLGGDCYTVIQVQQKLVFCLSDVSGYGVDSAMLSFFIKHTIKGFLFFSASHGITPTNTLPYLAEQFKQENYPEEYFICIFLGVLDLASMKMTYTRAGFQVPHW